jgi:hypothetical protein
VAVLLHIGGTDREASLFPGLREDGEEDGSQHSDHNDYHEQLDQGECRLSQAEHGSSPERQAGPKLAIAPLPHWSYGYVRGEHGNSCPCGRIAIKPDFG